MSEPNLFVYNDLDPNTTQIRLLTLHPGQFTDPLIAIRSTVSLDTKPHYEAISYVWGDETIRKDVQIDGTTMSITTNLEAALRHVRLPAEERIVWADAICINQRNILEKNHQVSMMGTIYKQCAVCLVWLGDDDSGQGKRAFDFLLASQEGHLKFPQCDSSPCDSDLRAVLYLLQRPWWTRVWTIQESLLPESVIFRCGRHALGLHIFTKVVENILKHVKHDQCCTIKTECDECVESIRQFFIALIGFAIRPVAGSYWRLIILLSMYPGRMASNELDFVYAILGLMNPEEVERLKIDYSMNPVTLYTAVTLEDIRLHKSLFVLRLAAGDGVLTSLLGLPSWVPDWSTSQRLTKMDHHRYDLYHACGPTLPDLGLVGEGKVLSILTITVDVVKSVGRALPTTELVWDQPDVGILMEWFELAFGTESSVYDPPQCIISTEKEPKEGIEPGTLEKGRPTAFWLTVTGDLLRMGEWKRRTSVDGKEAFWTFWDILISEIPQDLQLHDTNGDLALLEHVCGRKRFFVTEKGYFGIGTKDMRAGDEILVAEGGSCPLVLRRVEERPECLRESLDSSLMYELVGDCYLHGFMNGEAMTNFEETSKRVLIV